jgi:hypothetical protein
MKWNFDKRFRNPPKNVIEIIKMKSKTRTLPRIQMTPYTHPQSAFRSIAPAAPGTRMNRNLARKSA